jgi:hypothetical protein
MILFLAGISCSVKKLYLVPLFNLPLASSTLAPFQALSHSALHLFLNRRLMASLSNHLLHTDPPATPDHWDNMSQGIWFACY